MVGGAVCQMALRPALALPLAPALLLAPVGAVAGEEALRPRSTARVSASLLLPADHRRGRVSSASRAFCVHCARDGVARYAEASRASRETGWEGSQASAARVWAVSYTHLRAHETRHDLV